MTDRHCRSWLCANACVKSNFKNFVSVEKLRLTSMIFLLQRRNYCIDL